MTTKADFLRTVRGALTDLNGKELPILPQPPVVWPTRGLAPEAMARTFAESLTAAAGECVSCPSLGDAAEKIAALLRETDSQSLVVPDKPLGMEIASRLTEITLVRPPEDQRSVAPETFAGYDAALLTPEYLLADSGSALFEAPTAFDRLAVYLPPLCVVAARTAMLREHLPHAWLEFLPRWQSGTSGEFVIVTGPSRTADIEKILVLGVHGPKRLVVFLIDDTA